MTSDCSPKKFILHYQLLKKNLHGHLDIKTNIKFLCTTNDNVNLEMLWLQKRIWAIFSISVAKKYEQPKRGISVHWLLIIKALC